jgi:organic radical activating enzyme
MSKVIKIESVEDRSYYCSFKFRALKIDIEQKTTYNCDPARPHRVDFDWLEQNSGQLFNTPVNVAERHMMLDNKRNSSCEQNCWPAEDAGAVSPRILRKGYEKTHLEPLTQPEIIDYTIGSDCNLSCSYCGKYYSSAWRRDLLTYGNYTDIVSSDDRFTLTDRDRILDKTNQLNKINTNHAQILLNELVAMSTTLQHLIITGGEPFLNNSLSDIIKRTSTVPDIKIFTGLGVEFKRFERIIDQLAEYPNIRLAISAEATEKLYEFNRYGMQWTDFQRKIELLEKKNINYIFHSTLSNLSILGFFDFYSQYGNLIKEFDLVYQPDFMAVYVLDTNTKEQLCEQVSNSTFYGKEDILTSLMSTPTEQQRTNLKNFLVEFTRRRPNLDITIYPKAFLNWIEYVV